MDAGDIPAPDNLTSRETVSPIRVEDEPQDLSSSNPNSSHRIQPSTEQLGSSTLPEVGHPRSMSISHIRHVLPKIPTRGSNLRTAVSKASSRDSYIPPTSSGEGAAGKAQPSNTSVATTAESTEFTPMDGYSDGWLPLRSVSPPESGDSSISQLVDKDPLNSLLQMTHRGIPGLWNAPDSVLPDSNAVSKDRDLPQVPKKNCASVAILDGKQPSTLLPLSQEDNGDKIEGLENEVPPMSTTFNPTTMASDRTVETLTASGQYEMKDPNEYSRSEESSVERKKEDGTNQKTDDIKTLMNNIVSEINGTVGDAVRVNNSPRNSSSPGQTIGSNAKDAMLENFQKSIEQRDNKSCWTPVVSETDVTELDKNVKSDSQVSGEITGASSLNTHQMSAPASPVIPAEAAPSPVLPQSVITGVMVLDRPKTGRAKTNAELKKQLLEKRGQRLKSGTGDGGSQASSPSPCASSLGDELPTLSTSAAAVRYIYLLSVL